MPPFFSFMTGANRYRCEAANKEEALRYVFEALNPSESERQLILSTLYEEGAAQAFSGPEEPLDEQDDPS